jgi:hypothetical protein
VTDSRVTDQGNLRKYRTETPNIILALLWDSSLSKEDRFKSADLALYTILKRTAGDSGVCYKSSATLAKECSLSQGKIADSKKRLQRLGLVRIAEKKRAHGRPAHHITIVDVWPANMIYFSSQVEMSPSAFLKTWINQGTGQGIPDGSENETSRGDVQTSYGEVQTSGGDQVSSPGEFQTSRGEIKKEPKLRINPSKKNPDEEERESADAASIDHPTETGPATNTAALSSVEKGQGFIDPKLMAALVSWRGFSPDSRLPPKAFGQLQQMARRIARDNVQPSAAEYIWSVSSAWFAKSHFAAGKPETDPSRYPSNLEQMEDWYLKCCGNPKLLELPEAEYRDVIER